MTILGHAIRAVPRFNPILNRDLWHWSVSPGFIGSGFVNRHSGTVAVLHRSTKRAGIWQLSFFDGCEATGDSEFSEVRDALREVPPGSWELLPVEVT